MKTAWTHLPNAKHIDWVLASYKENPEAWKVSRNEVWVEAHNVARDAALNSERREIWDSAWHAIWKAVDGALRKEAWYAARGVMAALIVYDHCKKYLNMTPDELITWWKLSDDPACILLIPMVKVLQTQKELA